MANERRTFQQGLDPLAEEIPIDSLILMKHSIALDILRKWKLLTTD